MPIAAIYAIYHTRLDHLLHLIARRFSPEGAKANSWVQVNKACYQTKHLVQSQGWKANKMCGEFCYYSNMHLSPAVILAGAHTLPLSAFARQRGPRAFLLLLGILERA